MKITSVLLFALLLAVPSLSFAAEPAPLLVDVSSYEQLLKAIRDARLASDKRVEAVVEAEKVRQAWETGKLIDTHILKHGKRADYGKQILEKLAADLGTSQTELSFNLQFARAYPIYWPANKLSWSHYQALLSVNDPKERDALAEKALSENWGRDRLRDEIQKQKSRQPHGRKQKNISILSPGTPYTYKVIRAKVGAYQGQLALDLGFSNYYRSTILDTFAEGDILRVAQTQNTSDKSQHTFERVDSTDAAERQLYTYNAYLTSVIDGDTLKVVIDLGFGFATEQRIRLRAIDAPEVETTDGQKAKAFVEKIMSRESSVLGRQSENSSHNSRLKTHGFLLRSHRSDKYDRYLADIWVDGKNLNQALLDEDLATVVEES